jgi:hypothetical protein
MQRRAQQEPACSFDALLAFDMWVTTQCLLRDHGKRHLHLKVMACNLVMR